MQIESLMQKIKAHPDYASAGMVLYHNGVVRETSRDGRRVKGLRVAVDHDRLQSILETRRKQPGIVDIQVEIAEDVDLNVSDDVMLLAVAGDIRENVIRVLTDTLNDIKATVTSKTEYFAEEA